MLFPAVLIAFFGSRVFLTCLEEAGKPAALCLWLMVGFWVALISMRWPSLRLLRWAWVLAGLIAAASVPGGDY